MLTVSETLERLERDLLEQLAGLQRQIAPIQAELQKVQTARNALEPQAPPVRPDNLPPGASLAQVLAARKMTAYRDMTMKELAVKALREQFPNGATSSELLQVFHSHWNREDISRESLSPQLSRLKADGILALEGKRWLLVEGQKDEAPDAEASSATPSPRPEDGTSASPASKDRDIFD